MQRPGEDWILFYEEGRAYDGNRTGVTRYMFWNKFCCFECDGDGFVSVFPKSSCWGFESVVIVCVKKT